MTPQPPLEAGEKQIIAILREHLFVDADNTITGWGLAADALIQAARATTDDPELDGTDLAHPAYWRGEQRGCEGACMRIEEVLDTKSVVGVSNNARLQALRERLAARATTGESETGALERYEKALRLIAQQNPAPSNSADKMHENYLRLVLIGLAKGALDA